MAFGLYKCFTSVSQGLWLRWQDGWRLLN
jgi:hypothetical protein